MNYQIILTVYLIIQLVAGLGMQPKLSRLRKHTDGMLVGALIGTTLKYITIFVCLYMGGFYG